MKPLSNSQTRHNRSSMAFSSSPWLIGGLLTLALCLRIWMTWRGGQFFFPDEIRFLRAPDWILFFQHHSILESLENLFYTSDHFGYTLFNLPAGLIQVLLGEWNGRSYRDFFWVGGLFQALTSWACLFVTFKTTKLATKSNDATWALFLMIAANSMLYYSQHFLPYDTSLLFILLSFLTLVRNHQNYISTLIIGFLAGFAFQCYNGNIWTCAAILGCFMLDRAIFAKLNLKQLFLHGVTLSLSFLAPTVLFCLAGIIFSHNHFLIHMRAFSGTVTQGEFKEGPSLIVNYLLESEGVFFILLLSGIFCALFTRFKKRTMSFADHSTQRLFFLCLIVILLNCALLALGSAVFHKFVVYGRLVRPMVPFFCMAAAIGWRIGLRHISRKDFKIAALASLVLVATFHSLSSLYEIHQVNFPLPYFAEMRAKFGMFESVSCLGSKEKIAPIFPKGTLVLINPIFIYPPIEKTLITPEGEILSQAKHAMGFRPYHLEGFLRSERELLRSQDLSFKLIRVQ